MLPITIDAARVRIALIGNGQAAHRRLASLVRRRLPTAEEIARAQLVFLARLGEPAASQLRHIADDAGVLLNVEDDIARSDFHSPAVVRRGDLTVAISTAGKSPGLAAAIRRRIEASFGPEWDARLETIALLRRRWRLAGLENAAIARLTRRWFDQYPAFPLKAG